jgi:hypothetical protein
MKPRHGPFAHGLTGVPDSLVDMTKASTGRYLIPDSLFNFLGVGKSMLLCSGPDKGVTDMDFEHTAG